MGAKVKEMNEIPLGWVRMAAHYDTREDKKSGGPSDEYRRLLAAAKKNPPEFGVMNLRGVHGMLVQKDEADAYLQRLSPTARKAEPVSQKLLEKVDLLCRLVEELLEALA
jgi:hypothetical protein